MKIKDILSKYSSNLKVTDVEENGKYPVYGAQGIVGYRNDYQCVVSSLAVIKDGAGIGRVQKVNSFSSVIGTLQLLVPNGKHDLSYLFYLMKHLDLGHSFSGTTIPHIYYKDYSKIDVKQASYDDECSIGQELSSIDRAIFGKKNELNHLDSLIKSRFIGEVSI